MKKVFILGLLLLLFVPRITASDVCPSSDPDTCVKFYQGKVSEAQGQEKTLSSQIDEIDNQISLTKSQIDLTQAKIDRLTEGIASVSGKISVIQGSLEMSSKVLVNRIAETYKVGQTDPLFYLLSSADFGDFFRRLNYLQIVQKHDKTLMFQMAEIRKNYNDQKDLLETTKQQKEELYVTLSAQKATLDQQNREKKQLLAVTQNDEVRYQSLLAQAQAQLAAFHGFVIGQGGASLLSNQTSCNDWGCYYNQRDSQWGLSRIGLSNDSIAEYGCLVTSSAMVLSHYGHRVTPAQVASTLDAFFPPTAFMLLSPWSIDGATFVRTSGGGTGTIDSEVSDGHPVIVGIYGNSHFVVIKGKSGDDYVMNDPYTEGGHDIPFTSKYPISSISVVNTVRVN